MSGNKSKKIAFNYFGGKFTYIDEIYNYFPMNFDHMCELFAGSAVLTLNCKKKNIIKTINDINDNVTNFFEVLRNHYDELIRVLMLTPYSESEFFKCLEVTNEPIEKARRFYVRTRMSNYGDGVFDKCCGLYFSKKDGTKLGGQGLSRWVSGIDRLFEITDILRSVQIINRDYSKAIKMCDSKRTFFYADPPYLLNTRSSKKRYAFEMDDSDHIRLAQELKNIKGMAMISGYDSDLYNELYSDWNKKLFHPKKNHRGKAIKQEVIWFNYPFEYAACSQTFLNV